MTDWQKIIGNRIRQARINLGLSQETLTELADIHGSYIGQVERGEKAPSVPVLVKISDALRIPLNHILDGVEVPKIGGKVTGKTRQIEKLVRGLDKDAVEIVIQLLRRLTGKKR